MQKNEKYNIIYTRTKNQNCKRWKTTQQSTTIESRNTKVSTRNENVVEKMRMRITKNNKKSMIRNEIA